MSADSWNWDRFDTEARRLYDEGAYDAARELLEEGLSLHPGSAELRVSLGYAELAREEYAWARRRFAEALALEPEHEEALVGLAETLLRFGERGRAFLTLRRLLELGFGEDAELMLSAGRALYREGLWERAAEFFRRALAADPTCAEAAAEMGYTAHRLGRGRATERWCRRALSLDPELYEARVFLANLLYERGDQPSALVELERVPPRELWDPIAAWRIVELMGRLRELPPDHPRLVPYLERLDELTAEPSPEDHVLAEIEALVDGGERTAASDREQLDLVRWIPVAIEERSSHRVRLPDGRTYEGDWTGIVRAMRDDSAEPGISLAEFMAEEARRIHNLTGRSVAADDPRSLLEDAARLGILRIDR